MGTNEKLSEILLGYGFFSALGTTETVNGKPQLVGRGSPFTCDDNNGVIAIYDEDRKPWVVLNANFLPSLDEQTVVAKFREVMQGTSFGYIRRGAYVPHSNDGGKFLREVLPNL